MLYPLLLLSLVIGVPWFFSDAVSSNTAQSPHTLDVSYTISPLSTHQFTAYLVAESDEQRVINIPEGRRVYIPFSSGNWTSPSGELIAELVPGTGGEAGYVHHDGKSLVVDVKYSIKFIHDNTYGIASLNGFGEFLINSQVFTVLETDSEDYLHLTQRPMLGFTRFHDNVAVIPTFSFEL